MYTWIKQIVFFSILVTTMLRLLPKSGYEKYVRFFCGMLWLWVLASPILELFRNPTEITESLFREIMLQESGLQVAETKEWEETAENVFVMEYQKELERELRTLAEPNWEVYEIKIGWNGQIEPEKISLVLGILGQEQPFFESERKEYEDNSQDYPLVETLRKTIRRKYELEDSQIQIYVVEP